MSNPKLLFMTDRSEWHQQKAREGAPAGIDVIMTRRPSPTELKALLPDIDFLISERYLPVTAEMIEAARRLKLIVRLGSLTYDIDIAAAREAHVRVSMQPVTGGTLMSEFTLMMILATVKRLGRSLEAAKAADHGKPAHRTDENTFSFDWLGYTDIGTLHDKTVSILGMGEIGVELARRLKPFHLRAILYNKRTPYPPSVERELSIRYADRDQALREADIVVSLLPYSASTDRSINAAALALMKPTALLLHAGSGSVIDEQALTEALRGHKLAGASLDTYEYEPLQPDNPLVALARDPNSNLLLTPHTGGAYGPKTRAEDYSEIVRFINGEPLKFEVT